MRDYVSKNERVPADFTWKSLAKDMLGVIGFFSFTVLIFVILY